MSISWRGEGGGDCGVAMTLMAVWFRLLDQFYVLVRFCVLGLFFVSYSPMVSIGVIYVGAIADKIFDQLGTTKSCCIVQWRAAKFVCGINTGAMMDQLLHTLQQLALVWIGTGTHRHE